MSSCGFKGQQKAIGYAYAGLSSVNLRGELGVGAATTATIEHGERLEILETRRRFVRVRTKQGAEGWTDSTYLLTQVQMDDLVRLADRAASLPSQGVATVFDTLNIHTGTSRDAPSFAQIVEGEQIDVVAHRASERELPSGEKSADDWFLVRTKEHRAGWVLSRMLLMSIPDEIAQYANGHYITAYHALNSEGTSWLWATSEHARQEFDFDGLRVFVYNARKKSYETVYKESNLRGYYPVEQQGTSFSAVMVEKDGSLAKRVYSFNGAKVKLLSKEPWQRPAALPDVNVPKTFDTTPPKEDNWASKVRGFTEWWFGI